MPHEIANGGGDNLGVLSALYPQLPSIALGSGTRKALGSYSTRWLAGRQLVPCPLLLAVCLSPTSPGLYLSVYGAVFPARGHRFSVQLSNRRRGGHIHIITQFRSAT